MVFDGSPKTVGNNQVLTIGFAQAYHANDNDDNGGGDKPIPNDESDSLFDRVLPVLYALIIIFIVVVIAKVAYKYHRMKKREKLDLMTHEELASNAEVIMAKYNQRMNIKSDKEREKALKKWKKKNPHKRLEECNISQLNSSYF